ncbi:MAG: ABC transporter permease [Candidatus Methanoplasma sp.]|jgi:ABC-2 type transport system permease protein|nr:ABC transporter permease [Candidatus Methanoplasma sp.]
MQDGTYLSQTLSLVVRELKHWYRSRMQMFMVVIQPLIWLGLFGFAMNGLMSQFATGLDYFSFLALGMVIITALTTSMNAGMSLIWDRRFGFLDKLKAAPVPRGVIPLSKVLATTVKAVVQSLLVLVIALILGLSPDGLSVVSILTIVVTVVCVALTFSSIFVAMGLMIKSQEVLMGVNMLLNLPLMFASGAMFPTTALPDALKIIANGNPLTYAADAIRHSWGGMDQMISITGLSLGQDLIIMAMIAAAVTLAGMFFARRALKME